MAKNKDVVLADAAYAQAFNSIEIIDRSNPASVINIVEPEFGALIENAFVLDPELFDLEERQLEKKVREQGVSISPVINRLRLKFWYAYDFRAQQGNVGIKSLNIYTGVCTKRVFDKLMGNPKVVAWVMCPPTQYDTHMDEALAYGLDQLRLILEMPNYDKKGNPNTRLLDLKLKITQMIDMRKNGSFLMRSEQKNLHLNLHKTVNELQDMSIHQSMVQLEDKLKDLKARDNANLTFVEQTILETSKEDRPTLAEVLSDAATDAQGNAGADAPAGFNRSRVIEVESSGSSTLLESAGEEGSG